MEKKVLLTAVLVLSTVLTAIILLAFSKIVNITIHPAVASANLTLPQPNLHCDTIILRRKPSVARPVTPPWEVLLNNTATNRTRLRLYVHVWDVYQGRLGNRLFKYASLFGIAWRMKGYHCGLML